MSYAARRGHSPDEIALEDRVDPFAERDGRGTLQGAGKPLKQEATSCCDGPESRPIKTEVSAVGGYDAGHDLSEATTVPIGAAADRTIIATASADKPRPARQARPANRQYLLPAGRRRLSTPDAITTASECPAPPTVQGARRPPIGCYLGR